jgi:hypothetical protein|tara:strand:- start:228 stop:479 length:252 start_codon:yes stop_codon:yes gene_type:complete
MNKQPIASIDSWEVLTEKLLQLYAHEMIKLCEASEYTAPEVSAECEQQRADIRFKIIEIGRTLDEAEARYTKLVDEYQKDQDQ